MGWVFLLAAVPKLLRRREFEQALENYGLLPERLVRPGAFLLPWVEVLLAVSLFFGPIKPAAGIASTLLFAFATAVTVNLLQGRSIECGCLGVVAPRQISWYLVSKDVVLAIGALLIAIAPSSAAIDTHDVSVSDTIAVVIASGLFVLVEAVSSTALHAVRSARRVVRLVPEVSVS